MDNHTSSRSLTHLAGNLNNKPTARGNHTAQLETGPALNRFPLKPLALGFGTLLVTFADWTSWADTDRSLELLARYVAPHITGTADRPRESLEHAVAARGGS